MAGLFPDFITKNLGKLKLFGGDSGNDTNSSPSGANGSNNTQQQTTPKDFNELVDRIMDNPNIDNKTKREILTIILNNLQATPSAVAGLGDSMSKMQKPLPAMNQYNNHPLPPQGYYPPPFPAPPMVSYMPQYPGQFPGQPAFAFPQPVYMNTPQYYPYPQMIGNGTNQMDMLNAKITELSGEMAELLKLMRDELGIEGINSRNSNMERIRSMISKLDAGNNSSQLPASNKVPESLGDLPSKQSGNSSIIDTVGSAINSINTTLGLNSEAADKSPSGAEPSPVGAEPSPVGAEPSPVGAEPSPVGAEPSPANVQPELSDQDKQTIANEETAKATNNNINAQHADNEGTLGSNMFDLENYPTKSENKPIATNAQQESQTPAPITNTATNQKAPNNTKAPNNKSKNIKPIGNNLKPVEGNPSNMLVPEIQKKNPPANNLATAINNLNKTAQPTTPQTGGARTLKKSGRGVLSSMANALGLTNTTMKTGAKRGRPCKTK